MQAYRHTYFTLSSSSPKDIHRPRWAAAVVLLFLLLISHISFIIHIAPAVHSSTCSEFGMSYFAFRAAVELYVLVCLAFLGTATWSYKLIPTGISRNRFTRLTASNTVETLQNVASKKNGGWFPVLSLSNTVRDLPVQLEIAGEKLVAWRNPKNDEWSVMQDYCPHRLAPLSQGRVDEKSGCIECPYHGWQFDGITGACTKIPQLETSTTIIPASTTADSLPTYIAGDLLYAFVPLPEGQASYYPTLPDAQFPEVANLSGAFSRDLPYSFDFLIENFVDAAHIPFAHHSLQGVRSDGCSIPMEVLTSIENSTHCEVAFTDKIRGKPREGVVSFTAPSTYHFRAKDLKNGLFGLGLFIGCVPVAPGRSRVFIMFPPRMQKIFKFFPKWFLHSTSNKFVDSDLWVHDQELAVRNPLNSFAKDPKRRLKYVMPTDSDTGTRFWRKWWAQHMAASPVFGDPKEGTISPIPIVEQRNWYDTHAYNCRHCRAALHRAGVVKRWAPYLGLLAAAILPKTAWKVLGIVTAVIADIFASKVIRSVLGPQRGELTTAAQFASIDK